MLLPPSPCALCVPCERQEAILAVAKHDYSQLQRAVFKLPRVSLALGRLMFGHHLTRVFVCLGHSQTPSRELGLALVSVVLVVTLGPPGFIPSQDGVSQRLHLVEMWRLV